MRNDMGEYALTAPPVAVAGITLAGVTLQDWVYILTLISLALQIGWFLWKRYKEWKRKHHGR